MSRGRHQRRRDNVDRWAGTMLTELHARSGGPADIVSQTLASNRLGVPSVVFFGVAGAAPLTVIIGAISTIYAVVGNTALPLVYLVVAAILSLFTVGFVAMSRHIVNSGAFYSYISHGLGRELGISAALVALAAYSMMQAGLFGLFGVVASSVLGAVGVSASWVACALVAWAVVAVLGMLWVDLSGKVLGVLLVAEIAVVLIYDLVMVANPGSGGVSFAPLNPEQLMTPEVVAMMVLAISGFTGFEATVVLSEEAKDPKRTITRATHIALLITGLMCALSAWAMSVGAGTDQIAGLARQQTTNLVFSLVGPHVPDIMITLGYVLFMTSIFAALLAFHAAVSRYQFALGRERILPSRWGYTHPRTGAPVVGSITQSVLALAVIVGYWLAGADPLVQLFGYLTSVGGLGVLILMWGTSAAVIAFFLRHPHRENAWRSKITPIISFFLLSVILFATVVGLGDILGLADDSIFNWAFSAGYAVLAVLGALWAVMVRYSRPEAYASIGRGVDNRPVVDFFEPPPPHSHSVAFQQHPHFEQGPYEQAPYEQAPYEQFGPFPPFDQVGKPQ
ncbi:APC family permease [Actinoplanes oblitus]|uniref:APC family permease n=1 Tax=Actinoplanes oblitus TaxID=3040509 RepID=A0ABY8WNZ5_9ACTN|nr:APC family permease [Actinoplanes oblitus]WIM97500.1 APC family permease [Actinoplanes oblitus]